MSWNFYAIGTAEKLIAAIDEEAGKLTGQSKEEFDQAAPCLKGLVAMNTAKNYPRIVHVIANGHAIRGAKGLLESTCCAEIKAIGAKLVT